MKNKILIDEVDQYLKRLFPITRSITGPGNRETLSVLQEVIPLEIKEYQSGRSVYDWIIPDEWLVRDAWIKDSKGNKLVDFQVCNLHLVSYSEPVNKQLHFKDLRLHLYYHEELPDAIPYRTSYYKRDWGFCVTQKQYKSLQEIEGLLEVYIDSEFNSNGSLSVGELLIRGNSEQEILISTYNCHPSLANDNLSGVIMTAFLARELLNQKYLNFSYRIIWVPETIGAIAYCAMNEEVIKKIQTGLVVTTVGGPGQFGYKQSFDATHSINAAIEEVFKENELDYISYPFDIHGSDERQYSTQGFRINIASITKDKYYEYPNYHCSLDDLDFVKADYIVESLKLHFEVLKRIDQGEVYKNNIQYCEVMLSKYDLYPKTGGAQIPNIENMDELDFILWLLFWCDGKHTLNDIASRLSVDVKILKSVAKKLEKKRVLEKVGRSE